MSKKDMLARVRSDKWEWNTPNLSLSEKSRCTNNKHQQPLTPRDIHRMSAAMHISTRDFITKYGAIETDSGSTIPVVRLRAYGYDFHCPFYVDGQCKAECQPVCCVRRNIGQYRFNANYLKNFTRLSEDELFGIQWNRTCNYLNMTLSKLSEKHPAVAKELRSIVCQKLYMLDAEKEFAEEFDFHIQELIEYLHSF